MGSEAGDRLGQPIASATFFRCGQGPRSLPTLKCEVPLSGERIGVLRVCNEKSEAKSSRPQVEKASWVLGAWLSSLCRRDSSGVLTHPEMAATPASQSLPCSQAVDVWEARLLGALVSLVKFCCALLFTQLYSQHRCTLIIHPPTDRQALRFPLPGSLSPQKPTYATAGS